MLFLISGLLLGTQKGIRVKPQKNLGYVIIRVFQKYPLVFVLSLQYPWLTYSRHLKTSGASQICRSILLISQYFIISSANICVFVPRKNTEFDVNVDALLSFLSCVPGLTEVDIQAEYLTDIWTSKILSYLQVNPKISHIK